MHYVETLKTDIIVFISNNTLTINFQYHGQSVDAENIPQGDQRNNV
jgi:hypothetical protein